jgi:hypothetical protein
MGNLKTAIFLLLIITHFGVSCSVAKNNTGEQSQTYQPDDPALYNAIVQMDSIYFEAYNKCDMEKQAALFSDSLEFYHDKGGLTTSKQEVLDGIKRNVCGKVSRELVKGSIEVYPIKGYGAVEMGLHKFHNNTEKEGTPSHAGKFIIIWQQSNDQWIIKRVVSLH